MIRYSIWIVYEWVIVCGQPAHEPLDQHVTKRVRRARPIYLGRAQNAFTQDFETEKRCGGGFVKAAC